MDQELSTIVEKYKDVKGNVILILQEIQEKYQFLPEDILEETSNAVKVPLSEFYGVATFYSQFKFTKPGKYQIKVCHGTACHINDARMISETIVDELSIEAGETSEDGKFSLDEVACLGCCSLAPVIMINDRVFGDLDAKKLRKVIKEYKKES